MAGSTEQDRDPIWKADSMGEFLDDIDRNDFFEAAEEAQLLEEIERIEDTLGVEVQVNAVGLLLPAVQSVRESASRPVEDDLPVNMYLKIPDIDGEAEKAQEAIDELLRDYEMSGEDIEVMVFEAPRSGDVYYKITFDDLIITSVSTGEGGSIVADSAEGWDDSGFG